MRIGALIILAFLIGCNDDGPNDIPSAYEQVWSDFDRLYPYFEIKGIDWDSVYLENKARISDKTTEEEFAEILSLMTLGLRDLHVNFTAFGQKHQYQKRHLFPANSPENASNYLVNVSYDNYRILSGTIENSNITYVRIKRLSGNPDNYPEFGTILNRLSTKDALIVDLRENSGGNDAVGRAFVSRLTNDEIVFEHVRFRDGPLHSDFGEWIPVSVVPNNPVSFNKPIILLTNRGCYSSAESFVLMLKSLPNTIQMGDTTGGATANPRLFGLYNGWSYKVSTWQAATIDFQLIEENGIAPDINVTNTEKSFEEGRDLMLEKAIDQLNVSLMK